MQMLDDILYNGNLGLLAEEDEYVMGIAARAFVDEIEKAAAARWLKILKPQELKALQAYRAGQVLGPKQWLAQQAAMAKKREYIKGFQTAIQDLRRSAYRQELTKDILFKAERFMAPQEVNRVIRLAKARQADVAKGLAKPPAWAAPRHPIKTLGPGLLGYGALLAGGYLLSRLLAPKDEAQQQQMAY